jgi:predicted membrane protein
MKDEHISLMQIGIFIGAIFVGWILAELFPWYIVLLALGGLYGLYLWIFS